ncbi:MAG: MBL fold metallo-hydrolase [Bryobacteraceae bacterium]
MRSVPTTRRLVARLSILVALGALSLSAAKTMDIYFIDTEGGQATLIVTPSGQTLMIDAGWPGNSGRDAIRIAAAAKAAGVKKIDTLLTTHFHDDHVGGVGSLIKRLPVGSFVDYGPSVENNGKYPSDYADAFVTGEHHSVKPGDKLALKGVDATVLIGAGQQINRKGDPNQYCAGLAKAEGENGENPQSLGVLLQFGKFRFADLGDVLFNGEMALECPENKVGKVDLLITTHHATHMPPKSQWGLAPRVIVMNNGARKGGDPQAWSQIGQSPGLEDLWQLHYAIAGGAEHNVPDAKIANLNERECPGDYIKVSASEDGSFTVFNKRNKYTKTYGR